MENPLRELGVPLPFDRIRPEHVVPGVRALLADAHAKKAAIAVEEPRTFSTTLGALDAMTEHLELAVEVIEHLEAVATTPALREAWRTAQPEVSAFMSGIALDDGLWRAIQAFAKTPEAASLDGAAKRYLEKTLADFRRSGADLAPADKKRLEAIDVELAELTLRYGQNVLDSTNAFEIMMGDAARLAGLPESAVAMARESAADKGLPGYRLTLAAPSYTGVMTYLDDAAIREQMWRAQSTRATEGAHDNRPLVARILELRREKALLLGYETFADLVCEDRMVKTGGAARSFLAELRERTLPFFERENQELAAFRRETLAAAGIPDDGPIQPWDVGYWAEKLRRARYDLDEEALRPYFALDRVLEGIFSIAESLYGLRIEPWESAPIWHDGVRAFAVSEADGRTTARFYVDVFPRDQKRDGAWMHGLVTDLGTTSGHLEILAANVSPPTGGRPALLRHREVETLFHEFGHLMHHGASRVPIRTLAGTNVARDFVELPSQIMENWCWERQALDRFARHVESGAPIPEDLYSRMKAARSFRAGNAMMRQLGFAEVDLALHMDWDAASGIDPIALARDVLARHTPAPLPSDYAMVAGFGHLFASPVGYAAGYYSYKWAEVLDADAFSRFAREGILSPEVGRAFREGLLAQGDAVDPAELYRRFMGRDPRLDALFERDGLIG